MTKLEQFIERNWYELYGYPSKSFDELLVLDNNFSSGINGYIGLYQSDNNLLIYVHESRFEYMPSIRLLLDGLFELVIDVRTDFIHPIIHVGGCTYYLDNIEKEYEHQ